MHASFYEGQSKYTKALKIIRVGLKIAPENEKLLYFEGALYDKLGDRRKGIIAMRKILKVSPDNAHALNFLGYTFAELGENLEEAEELVARALKLRPDDGFIEDSMGWVLYKMGKIDAAIERLEKAAKMQPKEAIIFEHLGDVYLSQKKFANALKSYKRAFTLFSKNDKGQAKKNKRQNSQTKKRKPSPNNKITLKGAYLLSSLKGREYKTTHKFNPETFQPV